MSKLRVTAIRFARTNKKISNVENLYSLNKDDNIHK